MTPPADPNSLGYLIADISRLIRADFDRRIVRAGLGLTPGEASALLRVNLFPASRQSSLAEHMSIEPMTLSRYIDRLEAENLVIRQPDPADRRAKTVVLTEKGRVMVEKIRIHSCAMIDDIQHGLDDAARVALKHSLLKIHDNLTNAAHLSAAANG